MATRFLLDRQLLKEQEILDKILETVRKKPYPTFEATHLATFIHAMFRSSIEKQVQKKPEKKAVKKTENVTKQIIQKKALKRPLPPPPTPKQAATKIEPKNFIEKEYVVNDYNNPIGILLTSENNKPLYKVIEPEINKSLLKVLKDSIVSDFLKNRSILDNKEYLKKLIDTIAQKLNIPLTIYDYKKYQYYLKRDLIGFRKIDPLMQDPRVRSIYIDGVNKPVIIDHKELGSQIRTNVRFTSAKDLNLLLLRLAKTSGISLNEKNPILDTRINGFHIHGVMGIGDVSSKLVIKKW